MLGIHDREFWLSDTRILRSAGASKYSPSALDSWVFANGGLNLCPGVVCASFAMVGPLL